MTHDTFFFFFSLFLYSMTMAVVQMILWLSNVGTFSKSASATRHLDGHNNVPLGALCAAICKQPRWQLLLA